jgi:hypothetical protein
VSGHRSWATHVRDEQLPAGLWPARCYVLPTQLTRQGTCWRDETPRPAGSRVDLYALEEGRDKLYARPVRHCGSDCYYSGDLFAAAFAGSGLGRLAGRPPVLTQERGLRAKGAPMLMSWSPEETLHREM